MYDSKLYKPDGVDESNKESKRNPGAESITGERYDTKGGGMGEILAFDSLIVGSQIFGKNKFESRHKNLIPISAVAEPVDRELKK